MKNLSAFILIIVMLMLGLSKLVFAQQEDCTQSTIIEVEAGA